MRRKTRKYLSGILAAVLTMVMCLGNTSWAGSSNLVKAGEKTRKVDVWDLGGVEETDSTLYTNYITASDWDSCANVSADAKFLTGTTTFGDLTLTHNSGDRLYSTSSKNYGSSGMATTSYDDGYKASGMYYCNGTGGETRRFITVDNVQAGDTIVVYMGASNAATDNVCFKYLGEDGEQLESAEFSNTGKKYEFIAQYSGSYKIYAAAVGTAKPCINRVVRIPAVTVTGDIDLNGTGISNFTVTMTNQTTGVTRDAKVEGTKFSASLAAGYTYTATLSGAVGFGFTNDTKVITSKITDILTGISNVTLKVEEKSVYNYSGKVVGFDSAYDLSGLKVTLKAPEDSLADDVVLKLGQDLSYSETLEPDVSYTVALEGVNDYEVVAGNVICDNQALNADISVGLKAVHKASGSFLGLSDTANVTKITFTNVDDNYSYAGTVAQNGYEISLRDGSYAAEAIVEGYKTSTHVVVDGADVSKDILFVSTAAPETMEHVSDIYVGYAEQENNYATVKEAIAACAAMNPTSEAERITVHIAPGTYREQIIITTPYISLVNDSSEEVLLTWYYGIGYQYYSVDASGYYNAENAYDQYSKATPAKWGAATYLRNTATGFKADGITFEASFNRYITDEELEDGVEINGLESIKVTRKYGLDVTSKAATERSSAMAIEADNVEFTNCAFLGSQDTLYTGNSDSSIYFKNCRIEGNTDYIFGDGNCVFDACELKWFGYSGSAVGGYITAAKSDAASHGYLFRNCTITENADLAIGAGYLGRPWGAGANVTFLNTKLNEDNLVKTEGWTSMSGNTPQNAKFKEYNTTFTDGDVADLSGRVTGQITQAEADAVDVKAYFGDWTPSFFTEEEASVAFTKTPTFTDNGDINAPYPGHTMTAHYSLGDVNDASDASVIQWYLVSGDGKEELVKSSTANVDTTYQLTEAAVGKYVKLVVIPQTISGTTAAAASYTADAFVRDGYEDPSGDGSDITLGDGVNIFLAGDSTVKDYSAAGMHMSGRSQVEGSWGEFLQSFFDSSIVTIQNYANGGRSTRNFINEGSLDKMAANIGEGDYLFIQFGHNDCANGTGYLEDRYVPLGEPDAAGIYPTTEGVKVATPSSYVDKYGAEFYSYDCGGTYKWYLLQYIETARAAGATPILVTPVARLYYNADGTIKPHHDSTDTTTGTQVTSNNAYVEAVKQLGEEQGVQVIDAFELTKTMYEELYQADASASNGSALMAPGDSTHSNKLGGFLSAALIAEAIQDMGLNISKTVVMPSQIAGENPDGQLVFSVNAKNTLSAYIKDSEGNFTINSAYLSEYGQSMIHTIGVKHEELNKTPDAEESATVWVVGDSTVSSFNDAYYYPRYGWGTQLSKYFDSTLKVENLALSGRSSKSYTKDQEYQTLLTGMQSGDFLLVGFGHNDEKAEADRYTNPNGTYTEDGTFANSLYENYIKPAQEKGVTVILVTPIVRRTATGEWSNSNLHITSGSGTFAGGDYAQSIRSLGSTLNIPVVDMTTMTKNLYDTLGAEETLNLHAWNSSKAASVDNTHTNIWGGTYNAYLITKTIKELNVPGISSRILDAEAPAKDATLVSNPDYKETDYDGDLTDSVLWKKVGAWSGSVFGNVGGNPSTANQTLEKDAEGNIRIAVANNKGKIASTVDGLAMYYYKVPSNATFTLTATAKINQFDSNDQVSFGLMARDDMYIDKNMTDSMGDYVAAGPLKLAQESVWNCFARKSGVLTQGGTCGNTYTPGDSVNLKIESNSDGYACTFGNEETITGGFDFALTSIDSDYVYVGMYVARNADITFSNVKLVVNGVEVKEAAIPQESEDETETPTEDPTETPTEPTVPDENFEQVPVSGDNALDIDHAEISEESVLMNEKNETVNAGDIKIDIQKISGDRLKEVEELVRNSQIMIPEGSMTKFLEIKLKDKNDSIVRLENGKVRITLAEDETIDYSKVDVLIYHVKEDGTIEKLDVTMKDGKATFIATSFSPYMVVYQPKAETESAAEDGTTGVEDVQTGDTSTASVHAMLGMMALLVMAGLVYADRKKRRIKEVTIK